MTRRKIRNHILIICILILTIFFRGVGAKIPYNVTEVREILCKNRIEYILTHVYTYIRTYVHTYVHIYKSKEEKGVRVSTSIRGPKIRFEWTRDEREETVKR